MAIKKDVASQKIVFPMVDKTDFASPETGITPSGVIRKDGGASVAVSNTVSELTNGLYVLTLQDSETDAEVLAFRFHDGGTSCAQQVLTFYTETVTSAISNAISTLDGAVASAISNVISTLDDNVADKLASILEDTSATLDNKLDTILTDTETTLNSLINDVISELDGPTGTAIAAVKTVVDLNKTDTTNMISSLSNITSIVSGVASDIIAASGQGSSMMSEIISLLNDATNGLGALETITSQTLTDTGTTIPASISQVLSTLDSVIDDQITSILDDTGSAIDNTLSQILADTGTTMPANISKIKSAVDDIESNLSGVSGIVSDIFESLGTNALSKLSTILADTTSILVTTKTTIPGTITAVYSNVSNVHSTLDDVIGSQITDILVDTAEISNIATDSGAISAVKAIVSDIESNLSGVSGIVSDIFESMGTTVASQLSTILQDTETISNIASSSGAISAVNAIVSDIESNLSGVSGIVSDILESLGTSAKSQLSTILADTAAVLVDTAEISNVAGIVSDVESNLSGVSGIVSDIFESLGTNALSKLSTILADTTAILVDTGSTLSNTLSQILDDTEEIGAAGAGLTDVGGFATAAKSQINAEVLDVMNVDTYAEPGQEAPGATISVFAKINYLYKVMRNKSVQDATSVEIYNDAGAVVDQKRVISDDGTDFNSGEMITGP